MAHCYYHALSSVRKWGGVVDDYLALHQWFDQSKTIIADPRHRALRHHAEGIFMLETLFGATIVNADARVVPVRLVGEQHVREDLGSIPSFADWAALIAPRPWMLRGNPLDGSMEAAAGSLDGGDTPVLKVSDPAEQASIRTRL
jgi:hypothetical protein